MATTIRTKITMVKVVWLLLVLVAVVGSTPTVRPSEQASDCVLSVAFITWATLLLDDSVVNCPHAGRLTIFDIVRTHVRLFYFLLFGFKNSCRQ